MMSYFKKHFVTRVRNFVFTYKKSIKRKCHVTGNVCIIIYVLRLLNTYVLHL